jgi:hypothetical protein
MKYLVDANNTVIASGDITKNGVLYRLEDGTGMNDLEGNFRLLDNPPTRISPVEFKLCFTPQERIAIKAARATDPVLEDAFDILDDPRLTFVDLTLASTQGLIDYCVAQGHVTDERAVQIKAGVFL